MKKILFPYGKEMLEHRFEESELAGVLTSAIGEYKAELDGETLVKNALAASVDSPSLAELAKGKNRVAIIASDHTRPVPSKVIIPLMLNEIREGNPDADITILIATGCHRETTVQELVSKLGEDIVKSEKIAHIIQIVYTLILNVVNGKHGLYISVSLSVGIHTLEVYHRKGCLPIVGVEVIGIKIYFGKEVYYRLAKESKSFSVIALSVKSAAAVVKLVVYKIIGYSLFNK